MTRTLLLAVLLASGVATAQPATETEERAAVVRAFLQSLSPDQRGRAALDYDDPDRRRWSRKPGGRVGVAVFDLDPGQRAALHRVLRSMLSPQGYLRASAIMLGEEVAAAQEVELGGETALGPERYWAAVYGEPGAGPWSWRLEGHHLSLRAAFDGDRPVSVTPSAWGEYPAPFATGTRSGFDPLAPEDAAARRLARALSGVGGPLSERPNGLVTEADPFRVPTGGLAVAEMPGPVQALALALATSVASDYQPDLAAAALPASAADSMRFAWVGDPDTERPFYWRLVGAGQVIESWRFTDDYSGRAFGHVHRVWRDVEGDFGGTE